MALKIALAYCPAAQSAAGVHGPELILPPVGICSLSSFLRKSGYTADLFDLLLEFDTTVLDEGLRQPLEDLFAAARSERAYDPAVLSNLGFYLGLNRDYLSREVLRLYADLERTNPEEELFSANRVRRFLAAAAGKLACYDLVGLSIILEEQQIPALILAHWIRALASGTKIVVGGGAARPEVWEDLANCVVQGDGEKALLSYVLSQDKSAASEAGVPDGPGEVLYQENLDDLPPPDFKTLFTKYEYLAPVRIIPQAVTRGCYWSRCLFCTFGYRPGDSMQCTAPYRKMSAARVVEDVFHQQRENGTNFFFFSVDVVDPVLLEQIADELLRAGAHIFWSTGARAEKQLLRPGLLEKLYRSGCRSLSCGYESFNQRVLDSMQKGIRADHSVQILNGLFEARIYSNIGYFIGWPGETPEEAAETQATANLIFRKVPGNIAESFVPLQDSPAVRLAYQGGWPLLRYEPRQNRCLKRGMSWEAQYRQWLIFAVNFYCDSKNSCFSVRGDGGYALLYGTRYPLPALGDMFRIDDRSFGILGMGRLTFYGFSHTRHYACEIGARFDHDQFLLECPPACSSSDRMNTQADKIQRLDVAYRTVQAFIAAHDYSAAQRKFMHQVARLDYGWLVSCLREGSLPLVHVDEDGALASLPEDGSEPCRLWDFTIDVERVAQLAPLDQIREHPRCRVRFDRNGFRVLPGS